MIQFENVYKSYKSKSVLQNINLTVRTGEFMVLIGASGCGKTTLLKMINKLNTIDQGDILLDGVSVTKMNDTRMRRKIGYVVQDGGLFPHMTVAENISIILKVLGVPKKKQEARINELLEMVDLDPDYRSLYPSQLSGGQQHRVGVARAFAADPGIILMDEPFSALDPVVRAELQDKIVQLQKKLNKTILFVTHDMDEAIKIADKICIMKDGHILQYDIPEEILRNPADDYVANFVGVNRIWDSPEYIKVEDFMIRSPITCSGELNAKRCVTRMKNHHIDTLLVTDTEDKLLGMVGRKALFKSRNPLSRADDIMSSVSYTAHPQDSIVDVLKMIDEAEVNNVPVVDDDGKLVGLLTNSNLVSTLSKQFLLENQEVTEEQEDRKTPAENEISEESEVSLS